MSRELTDEECTAKLLASFKQSLRYWAKQEGMTVEERMDGLVFSILVTLDGDSMNTPSWRVVPNPHESDRKFHQDEGEDWWPENLGPLKGESKFPLHELWSMKFSEFNK